MRVVIDSNVIIRDFHMDGSSFRVFRSEATRAGHQIFIPEVVIEEVVNKYSELLQQRADKLESAIRNVEQHARIDLRSPIDADEIKKLQVNYRDELDEKLLSISTTISFPTTPHETLVRRALDRRRPFQSKGRGYRDALLWQNVLNLAADDSPDPIAFISGNSKDFAVDKNQPGNLHADFEADLASLGNNASHVALFPDLDAFVDEQIKPHLTQLDKIRNQLQAGTHPRLDLMRFVQTDLDRFIGWMEFDARHLGILLEVETANFSYLEQINRLDVSDVRRLANEELLIEVEVEGEVHFDIYIPKYEFYGLEGDEPIEIIDSEWNEWTALATTPLNAELGLRLVVNDTDGAILSVEVTSAEPLEDWWQRRWQPSG